MALRNLFAPFWAFAEALGAATGRTKVAISPISAGSNREWLLAVLADFCFVE
jgi:hypothetical protein